MPKGRSKTSAYKKRKGCFLWLGREKEKRALELALSLFDANCVCTGEKMQCPAKLTAYLLFTAGCCTCGFCIHSRLPVKSSAVPGLPSDIAPPWLTAAPSIFHATQRHAHQIIMAISDMYIYASWICFRFFFMSDFLLWRFPVLYLELASSLLLTFFLFLSIKQARLT